MSTLDYLSNLFLPTKCVICHKLPKTICDQCWSNLVFSKRKVSRGPLFGYAISEYVDEIATLLISYKERGSRIIGELLTEQIIHLISKPNVDLLVAAPSSLHNFSVRGFSPADVISKRLSNNWKIPMRKAHLLNLGRDQSQLDRSARLSNLVGRMTLDRPLIDSRVLLVDDIVTTGSTLTELARAVTAAGGQVSGFVCIAETIPKPHTKN